MTNDKNDYPNRKEHYPAHRLYEELGRLIRNSVNISAKQKLGTIESRAAHNALKVNSDLIQTILGMENQFEERRPGDGKELAGHDLDLKAARAEIIARLSKLSDAEGD